MKRTPRRAAALAVLAILLLASLPGCGDTSLTVTGNVTCNGQPIERGAISFRPADSKGPSVGGEIKDGKYAITSDAKNAGGKKIVQITGVRKAGQKIDSGPPEPPGTMVDEYVPFETGPRNQLTCELVPGQKNEEDFDVKIP